jgi:hypothetical protein
MTFDPTVLYTLLDTAQFVPLLSSNLPVLNQPTLYTSTALVELLNSISSSEEESMWLLAVPITPGLIARLHSDASASGKLSVQRLDALHEVSVRRQIQRTETGSWDTGELVY